MKLRTKIVSTAAAGLLLLSPAAALAESESDATAAKGGDGGENSFSISHTNAKSDGDSGEASANVIETNGEPASEEVGGSAGDGESNEGAAFDSTQQGGEDAPGSMKVAPWEASSQNGQSEARAALLRLTIGPEAEVATLDVLQSESTADGESAKASTDGAKLTVGGDQLVVTVLHAEESTESGGVVYVVGINEEQIVTGEDADGQCAVQVPGVIDLNCLVVSEASDDVATAVARVANPDDSFAAQVLAAQGQSKGGPAGPGDFTDPGDSSTTPGGSSFDFGDPSDSGEATRAADSGSLPVTGLAAGGLAAAGLAALALGGVSQQAARTLRRNQAPAS